jgi:hypothetical protein
MLVELGHNVEGTRTINDERPLEFAPGNVEKILLICLQKRNGSVLERVGTVDPCW